jgi:enolase
MIRFDSPDSQNQLDDDPYPPPHQSSADDGLQPSPGIQARRGQRFLKALSRRTRRVADHANAMSAGLQEGWVIANHILVSFHVAFISSILALPAASVFKGEVLRFIFLSPETLVSALFMYITFHAGITLHEMGHYRTAARLNALNDSSQRDADRIRQASFGPRVAHALKQFLLTPYGKAVGIKREGLNYYPDAPYNLAVAAAGPRASRNVASAALPPAAILLATGLAFDLQWAVYLGRLSLGIGIVGLLDFLLADPGKYAEFKKRERKAKEKAATVTKTGQWWDAVAEAKHKMLEGRIQKLTHPRLGPVTAPWQFRNCGMGGRHTEKEYPESNISMQEAMFLILGARDYQEAQEMTVRLQNRLKEIIEKEEGCRVMGIGLEGGLAPYIERGRYPLPEVRLWAMMKQTIEECGYRPGVDVAIALDPAMSELEIAYRKQFKVPDSVGMYLFWRDKTLAVMDRDGILDLYVKAIKEYDIPILSIEDGFSENDFEGWQKLLNALGDRVFVIGDDLVTTNDRTIELAAEKGLINTALIKANQIGTLYETILAMLVAMGKGQEIVVSHRSKSPNDDMEAQIALAVNSLGLKCGGGANTERLVKYHAITQLMQKGLDDGARPTLGPDAKPVVRKVFAYEEPTNAGIPSVGATVELELLEEGVYMKFKGATPLGTSAGAGEAIHLVDSAIERAEYREIIDRHAAFFKELEPGVYEFHKKITEAQVKETGDDELTALYNRAQRYEGKGCLNAVDNVTTVIAPMFNGRNVAVYSIKDVDRMLLSLELRVAKRRGKLDESASSEQCVHAMQRKQNLGMNAVLSVSLAMARGVAHLRGKDLFELLREEMFSIIDSLAAKQGVQIKGSRFSDYISALREVNQRLEAEGIPLYETLRELTGVYRRVKTDPLGQRSTQAVEGDSSEYEPGDEAPETTTPNHMGDAGGSAPVQTATVGAGVGAAVEAPVGVGVAAAVLVDEDKEIIASINHRLYEVCREDTDSVSRRQVLRQYVSGKQAVSQHVGQFGLVNNRVYISPNEMIVPYLVGDLLVVFRVPGDSDEPVLTRPIPAGTILTDDFVKRSVDFEGETIDLENELFELDVSKATSVRVGRIRDMADQLQRISKSANRNFSVYILRILVARLSLFSFKKYLNAKNLQTEVHNLLNELMAFLNTPLSYRLPFLVRILVRNISGVVSKPKLIDQLWNDSIDLAEVHVRGSDIVNELRRSTHHAVGKGTLLLAAAYLEYLESGATQSLARLGYPKPNPADEEARKRDRPKEIVSRLLANLEQLLGSSEIVGRIREWQENFASTLIRCEFGRSIPDEAEAAVTEGIGEQNRWTYYHHLRIIRDRVGQFGALGSAAGDFGHKLEELLELKPDESPFDDRGTENELRRCVDEFVGAVRSEYQDELFERIESFIDTYNRQAYFESFEEVLDLRENLRAKLEKRAFPEQRLLLYELDCLLEEAGYVALRHVSSQYDEEGVDIVQCLQIIRGCAVTLTHDGLHSRQLRDLVGMLTNSKRTYAELENIITQIQRNYHHILWRLITPFEKMREKLELDEEELRISLANMQRFLHDLNNMAAFADIALSYIKNHVEDKSGRVVPETAVTHNERDCKDFIIHLSHTDEIRGLVNSDNPVCNLRECYGGKGSGLVYISHLGVPTRDGFILPTSLGKRRAIDPDDGWLDEEIDKNLGILEGDIFRRSGVERKFGGRENPLLVAVRGGSVFSMPGILKTVLFVGMNDEIAARLAERDPWHAYDSYRRFLASFGHTVWGVDIEKYNIVENTKARYGVMYKYELPWEGMKEIEEATKAVLQKEGFGDALEDVLENPSKQLYAAVRGVFDSWNGDTTKKYRGIKGYCDSWQSAVIVQEMASGNRKNKEIRIGMDETQTSLTGVIPRTIAIDLGIRECTGEFKFSAAGEDLVGGLTTSVSFHAFSELATYMPMLNRRLRHTVAKLRRFMGTDQDIEFTVDQGVLSILQSRAAEIGVNREKFSFKEPGEPATRGIGIRGGAFRGLVAFDEADYNELMARDLSARDDVDGIIMVIENPGPADVPLVLSAGGLLSAKGGTTSHTAIAINGIEHKDYHAVMSAEALRVNARKHEAVIGDGGANEPVQIRMGDILSIHGTSGAVYVGSRRLERA